MKILYINRFFCEFSAGESLTYKTYQYMQSLGHDVYFFSTNKKPYFVGNYEYEQFMPKDKFSIIEYIFSKNSIPSFW